MRKYKPKDHGENRMKNEGDVILARENFYEFKNKNLEFLIRKRFSWMNKFINKNHQGIEVGCGTGVSKEYIKNDNYMISDFSEHNFLDYKNIDALNTGFKDESFDFVVSSNMIHHVPYPMKFFNEMHRILKSEGLLIIQEINCSYMMMKLLRLMRHEGFDFTIDVYDSNLICTDEDDLWSANCAIPNLLFDNILKFEKNVPCFKVIKSSHSEFFNFINSGGVISKTFYLPLPYFLLKLINKVDQFLCFFFPNFFSLQRQIVLKKNETFNNNSLL